MSEGKVVHVSAEMHEKVKKFCQQQGLAMKAFVEDSLDLCMKAAKEVDKDARHNKG